MRTLATFVGSVVLFLYVLAWLGLVDFYLCIGEVGKCVERSTPASETRKLRWRNYVESEKDPHGEFVAVKKRPGE